MGTTPSKIDSVHFSEFEKGLPSLAEKNVAITGCTSGTGLVVAKTCARKGASAVLLLNRPSERATKAEEEIKKECVDGSNNTKVETIPCDLQDFASVKEAANKIKEKYEAIDVLCCNAGVMALDDEATKDLYDVQIQTNYLSHFLLIKDLYPLLNRAQELRKDARVVQHTSLARKGGTLEAKYFEQNGGNLGGNSDSFLKKEGRWERYHQSKLANAVSTLTLADKFKENGMKAVCAAPGLAATNLQTTSREHGGMTGKMWMMRFAQSAEDGTMPLLTACFDLKVQNGDFYEPQNGMGMHGLPVKKELEQECKEENSKEMLWKKSEECHGKFPIQ